MYLAVDPGKGAVDSIGVAFFNDDGTVFRIAQFTFDDFVKELETMASLHKFTECVYEDYRIFKRKAKAHIGSRVETVQSIGVLKSWAVRNGVSCVSQPSDILPAAQKLFQIKIPDDHSISHQFSALLHGRYYLYRKGLVKSALEIELEAAKNAH